MTYMSFWKLQSAFLMGFMLSAKISLHMRTILPDRSAASERCSNGGQTPSELFLVHTEVNHPRFQDLGLCYAYRTCEETSAFMADSKVWKWERLPVGNGQFPSLTSTSISSRYLGRRKLNFWAAVEAKWAQKYKDNHVSPKGHLVLSFCLSLWLTEAQKACKQSQKCSNVTLASSTLQVPPFPEPETES